MERNQDSIYQGSGELFWLAIFHIVIQLCQKELTLPMTVDMTTGHLETEYLEPLCLESSWTLCISPLSDFNVSFPCNKPNSILKLCIYSPIIKP